jgi:predicted nucleic acid-binding protein
VSFSQATRAIVVDASASVPMLTAESPWPERWQGWVEADSIVLAPAHYPAEVANALLRSVRLPASEVQVGLDRLDRLGVETADRGPTGLRDAVALADRHGLTVYDALYLQLALDVEGELATLDRDLATAAEAEGIVTLGN